MAEFTENGEYIPNRSLAGDLRSFLERECCLVCENVIKALSRVPHYAMVYLHENGLSLEVRSSAGLHLVIDVGDDGYKYFKLIGLKEAKTSIDNVPIAPEPAPVCHDLTDADKGVDYRPWHQEDSRFVPRYLHDCDTCQFIGQFDLFDLYWCKGKVTDTLIARRSSVGSDYGSMEADMAEESGRPEMREAYIRYMKLIEEEAE